MQARTVFQWKSADFTVQAPSRVEGKVWVQGRLWLSPSDPSDANVRNRLHADLKTLRDQGTDWRPLDTTVELRPSAQPGGFNNELSRLGLSFSSVGSLTVPNWTGPGAHLQYQLYPGGVVYTTPRIGSLQNTTLAPDLSRTRWGFLCATDITIGDNVAVRDTLIAGRDIFINGRNVSLEAADLPPVAGSVRPLQLPTLTGRRRHRGEPPGRRRSPRRRLGLRRVRSRAGRRQHAVRSSRPCDLRLSPPTVAMNGGSRASGGGCWSCSTCRSTTAPPSRSICKRSDCGPLRRWCCGRARTTSNITGSGRPIRCICRSTITRVCAGSCATGERMCR